MAIQSFSDPQLYDRIAQEINTALDSKFDNQYPVCWARTENEETVPEVYQNDGTKINIRVMPDDASSLSFFTVEGDLIELDEMDYSCPMSIIAWINLQIYDTTKSYDYTTEIIRDVTNVLRKYGAYDFTVNVNTPFEGFTMLDKVVDENIMRPFTAFKISFTKNIRICYPATTGNVLQMEDGETFAMEDGTEFALEN